MKPKQLWWCEYQGNIAKDGKSKPIDKTQKCYYWNWCTNKSIIKKCTATKYEPVKEKKKCIGK